MQRIPDVKFTVFSLEKCDRIKKSEEFDRARQQLTCGNIPYDSASSEADCEYPFDNDKEKIDKQAAEKVRKHTKRQENSP